MESPSRCEAIFRAGAVAPLVSMLRGGDSQLKFDAANALATLGESAA